MAAVAAVNAAGDVIAEDGSILVGPRGDDGEMVRGADHLVALERAPEFKAPEGTPTLVCACTDAPLTKRECGMVARAATAGIARRSTPLHAGRRRRRVLLASGTAGESRPYISLQIGAAAATVAAAAIRDAVRQAA